jgi:hypothetical protein
VIPSSQSEVSTKFLKSIRQKRINCIDSSQISSSDVEIPPTELQPQISELNSANFESDEAIGFPPFGQYNPFEVSQEEFSDMPQSEKEKCIVPDSVTPKELTSIFNETVPCTRDNDFKDNELIIGSISNAVVNHVDATPDDLSLSKCKGSTDICFTAGLIGMHSNENSQNSGITSLNETTPKSKIYEAKERMVHPTTVHPQNVPVSWILIVVSRKGRVLESQKNKTNLHNSWK